MLKYLFFCLILTLTTGFSANGQLYTFRSFDHKDGLSLSSVLSVAEDQDGFIWFGTDGVGLIRYDGKDFDNLTEFQGRTSRHISNISFSKDNILYFSTEYQGFYTSNWQNAVEIDYVPKMGRGQAIVEVNDNVVVVEDAAIFVLKGDHKHIGDIINDAGEFKYGSNKIVVERKLMMNDVFDYLR